MPIHMASVGKVMTDGSVIVNPKYSTCRGLCQHQKWVFGIYNLEIKDGFIRLVQKREVGSQLPISQQAVLPCTKICSNECLVLLV